MLHLHVCFPEDNQADRKSSRKSSIFKIKPCVWTLIELPECRRGRLPHPCVDPNRRAGRVSMESQKNVQQEHLQKPNLSVCA